MTMSQSAGSANKSAKRNVANHFLRCLGLPRGQVPDSLGQHLDRFVTLVAARFVVRLILRAASAFARSGLVRFRCGSHRGRSRNLASWTLIFTRETRRRSISITVKR